MDLGIQGKVALVTGGSRGLGKVAALSLAREGVNVAICGRTQSTLDGTVAELEALGVSAQGVVADVTDVDAMPPLAQAVVDGLGPIDILVNNAGGSRARQDIADLPLEDFKAAFDLNLFGSFQLMRAVIPTCASSSGAASSTSPPSTAGNTAATSPTWQQSPPSSAPPSTPPSAS